jgi:hypothetical protein
MRPLIDPIYLNHEQGLNSNIVIAIVIVDYAQPPIVLSTIHLNRNGR